MNLIDMLEAIAAVVRLAENPTGGDCRNVLGATILFGDKRYEYNGQDFDLVDVEEDDA